MEAETEESLRMEVVLLNSSGFDAEAAMASSLSHALSAFAKGSGFVFDSIEAPIFSKGTRKKISLAEYTS